MGHKLGGGSTLFVGEGRLSLHQTQSPLGWGQHPYQVASWCIEPFGHNRNGPKIVEGAPPLFGGRGLGPHLTQSRLGWGLPPCQVPASFIHPFGCNKHGRKFGGAPSTFWWVGAGTDNGLIAYGGNVLQTVAQKSTGILGGNLLEICLVNRLVHLLSVYWWWSVSIVRGCGW